VNKRKLGQSGRDTTDTNATATQKASSNSPLNGLANTKLNYECSWNLVFMYIDSVNNGDCQISPYYKINGET